jgi:hypothetical protein
MASDRSRRAGVRVVVDVTTIVSVTVAYTQRQVSLMRSSRISWVTCLLDFSHSEEVRRDIRCIGGFCLCDRVLGSDDN